MLRLQDFPIKYQLIIMIFAISLVSLWVASTAFIFYDRHAYKETMVHELTVLARIIANRSASALVYNDASRAQRNLDALAVNASIESACITNAFGKTIAWYSRDNHAADGSRVPPELVCLHDQSFIFRFDREHLDLLQPILWESSQRVGELHIREDLSQLRKRFEVFSVVMVFIIAIASLVAIFLSARIQRFVSQPLLRMTAIADRVTQEKDFSQRATANRADELGRLVTAFNLMLDTIDEQNKALLVSKEHLEEQVDLRTAELRNINRELEAFTYSVSHDLRSPLRSIDGFSTALMEDFGNQLNDAGKDYVQRIQSASQQMGKLIDSMLFLSRVSRQEVSFQAMDLVPMANEIVQRLVEQSPNRQIQIQFQCPKSLVAFGDRALVALVLENLLSNAWKYSGKMPAPRVELGSVERDGEVIYFVRDNGVGFDMKYADRLFGPFQRLHRSDEFEGLGVGLATVARVIHRHGGEIWAESIVGSGAVFYFTLGSREQLH